MHATDSDSTTRSMLRRGRGRSKRFGLLTVLLVVLAGGALFLVAADQPEPTDVLGQLRQIPSATLSDAVDQVVGRRGFMNHDLRPVGGKRRMAGRARTVQYGPASQTDPSRNNGPAFGVELIDTSGPGIVMVASTGDLNITGLGGLMARTAHLRGLEGAVVDGAVRDVEELEAFGLPVFARAISPSTMVGRGTGIGLDIPIDCGGVTVSPGDYLVGDRDGVVCIPAEHVQAVIAAALKMEATEKKMIPMIQKLKSLRQVIEIFKRI